MDVHCYHYQIGKPLDFTKLHRVADLTQVAEAKAMRAQYGQVTVLLFQSGELRAFVRGGTLAELKEALLSSGVKIMSLLQEIKKAGITFDEQAVFASGAPMVFEYTTPLGARPAMDERVHIDSLREMVYAPYAMMPKFQLERNSVQAGENIGRALSASAKDAETLDALVVRYLKEKELGVAESSAHPDETGRSQYDVHVFRVNESAFAAGMPMVNEALCHFIRGIIRGAYAGFLEQENVAVKETRCWGLGDTFCEFEMRVTPK